MSNEEKFKDIEKRLQAMNEAILTTQCAVDMMIDAVKKLTQKTLQFDPAQRN